METGTDCFTEQVVFVFFVVFVFAFVFLKILGGGGVRLLDIFLSLKIPKTKFSSSSFYCQIHM